MIVYRVILKVGYNEAYFEFESAGEATDFATNALKHSTSCDDTKKKFKIMMAIVDAENEEEEE